ncbi:Rib/alpha-like domain-containing protein [Lactobacillus porci]|uniref:Rib/alpha-like domain-containing protein n=1 Tax=Lactobacillus porci TaxID=2012477 RepID=UPI00399268E0
MKKDIINKLTLAAAALTLAGTAAPAAQPAVFAAKKSTKTSKKSKKTTKKRKQKTNAQTYAPAVQGQSVYVGTAVTAQSVVTNASALPAGSKFAFTKKVNYKKAGIYKTAVKVTYPDKSSEKTKTITVKVQKRPKLAKLYAPIAVGVTAPVGSKVTAKSVVINADGMPYGSKYAFTKKVNCKKAGTYKTAVKITYLDKSTYTTNSIKIVVTKSAGQKSKAKSSQKAAAKTTLASQYAPKAAGVTTTAGKKVSAKALVANASQLPKGTKYAFTKAVDFTTAGTYQTAVKVTYADKSSERTKSVAVVVKAAKTVKKTDAEIYEPALKSAKAETYAGESIGAKSLVKNVADLPKGTKFSFAKAVDFSKEGKTTAQIKATYPDKSWDLGGKVTITVSSLTKEMQIDSYQGKDASGHPIEAIYVTNNADISVALSAVFALKDKKGNSLSTSSDAANPVGPGETAILYAGFYDSKSAARMDYTLTTKPSKYNSKVVDLLDQDKSNSISLTDTGVNLSVANKGTSTLYAPSATAIFLKDDKLVGVGRAKLDDGSGTLSAGTGSTATISFAKASDSYDNALITFSARDKK